MNGGWRAVPSLSIFSSFKSCFIYISTKIVQEAVLIMLKNAFLFWLKLFMGFSMKNFWIINSPCIC